MIAAMAAIKHDAAKIKTIIFQTIDGFFGGSSGGIITILSGLTIIFYTSKFSVFKSQ